MPSVNTSASPLAPLGQGRRSDEDELARISEKLDQVSNAGKTAGNSVQPFIDGENAFPELLKSLDSAKHSITYETYVVGSNDKTTHQVVDALIAAKRRGVDVKFIADAFGAKDFLFLHNAALTRLRNAGVTVELYNPLRDLSALDPHRDHRKTVVVDGTVGWLGGMNTGDEYFGDPTVKDRLHDVFAKVQGGAVDSLISDFSDSWAHANDFAGAKAAVRKLRSAPGGTNVRIVEHVPKQDTNVEDTYLTLINSAQKNIYLENKYPLNARMVAALSAAAKRGVQVHYIVSLGGPLGLLTEATFPDLLKAGVHIHLYPTGIHAKVMSVDGLVSTLGSSNMDNFSFARNREIIAVMEDPAFTRRFDQTMFRRDMMADHQGNPTRELQADSQGLMGRAASWLLSRVVPSSLQ